MDFTSQNIGSSSQDINGLWDSMKDSSFYFLVADMFGYSQDVSKENMRVALDTANEKEEVDEKNARAQYKTDSDNAANATTFKPGHYQGLSTGGTIGLAGIGIGIAVLAMIGGILGAIFTAGASMTLGFIVAGLAVGLAASALAGVGVFSAQLGICRSNGGCSNLKEFWAGGKNNLNKSGNTKDGFGSWTMYTDYNDTNQSDYTRYNGYAQDDLNEANEIRNDIQTIMSTQYTQEQNEESTEMDNFNKILKDFLSLTQQTG